MPVDGFPGYNGPIVYLPAVLWTLAICALSLLYARWGPEDRPGRRSRLYYTQALLLVGMVVLLGGSVLHLGLAGPGAEKLEFSRLSFDPSGNLVVTCLRKFEAQPEEIFWLTLHADGTVTKQDTYREKQQSSGEYELWAQWGRAGERTLVANQSGDLELPLGLDPTNVFPGIHGVVCYSANQMVFWSPRERHDFPSGYSIRGACRGQLVCTEVLPNSGERLLVVDPKNWQETRLMEYPQGKTTVYFVHPEWIVLEREGAYLAVSPDGKETKKLDDLHDVNSLLESPSGRYLLGFGTDQTLTVFDLAEFKSQAVPAAADKWESMAWVNEDLLGDPYSGQVYSLSTRRWIRLDRKGDGELVVDPSQTAIYQLRKANHWDGVMDVHDLKGKYQKSISARQLLERAEAGARL